MQNRSSGISVLIELCKLYAICLIIEIIGLNVIKYNVFLHLLCIKSKWRNNLINDARYF